MPPSTTLPDWWRLPIGPPDPNSLIQFAPPPPPSAAPSPAGAPPPQRLTIRVVIAAITLDPVAA